MVLKLSAILAALFLLPSATPLAARPPNFIVILADDLGYGDLGVYGHPSIRTPRIDRMAEEGVRLTEFYAAAPVCTPSRAALLTGRYAQRSGMVRVIVPKEKWGLPDSEITLAEALKDAGYTTGMIGKWHLGGRKPYRPQRHGFDSFLGVLYSNDMTLLPLLKWPRFALLRDNKPVESPAKVKNLTRHYTLEAVRFIAANKDRPFFLFLSHTMPHVPARPSDAFAGQSAFGRYGDVVEEMDASTGEVLEALKENGIDENTMVVFSSDNGPHMGGVPRAKGDKPDKREQARGSAGDLRGAKGTTWEGGMRVPFVARWPKTIPAGGVRGGIATMMDLFPTFLKQAGAALPRDRVIDGRDLLPFLKGKQGAPHDDLYYYFRKRLFAVRSADWKLHFFKRELTAQGKVKDAVRNPHPELYNLSTDPSEKKNVAQERPDVVARLTETAKLFNEDVKPAMKLPAAPRSVFFGVLTKAPEKPERVPK
jgi:arylsulfatase A-like enzyme